MLRLSYVTSLAGDSDDDYRPDLDDDYISADHMQNDDDDLHCVGPQLIGMENQLGFTRCV